MKMQYKKFDHRQTFDEVEVWGNYRRIDRLRISASPMPTSLVTFLFGHKKVTLPHFQIYKKVYIFTIDA